MVGIEHPSGMIAIDFDADFTGDKPVMRRAALVRTARRIFDGHVYVPENVWAGASHGAAAPKARAAA
jgi:4-oxalomesaconate tautomerase